MIDKFEDITSANKLIRKLAEKRSLACDVKKMERDGFGFLNPPPATGYAETPPLASDILLEGQEALVGRYALLGAVLRAGVEPSQDERLAYRPVSLARAELLMRRARLAIRIADLLAEGR